MWWNLEVKRTCLEENNAERQHLLADIELVLSDADITEEVVGKGIGNVATVKLYLA